MEQNLSRETRTESDLIGSREVPADALYGVQTLRGIENFRISKFHLNEYPLFINALAITKMGAAVANYELGLLTKEQVDAILKACKEILEGEHHEQFPVDMIQGGAGTSFIVRNFSASFALLFFLIAPILCALAGAFSTPPEALTCAPIYFM